MTQTVPHNAPPAFKLSTVLRYITLLTVLYLICYAYKSARVRAPLPAANLPDITQITMASHRLLATENTADLTPLYYRDVSSFRNSSYPFISGDTFRSMADYVFDEARTDNLAGVQHGDIVFVKGDVFYKFFFGPFRFIDNPFVLVSHNSDRSAPGDHLRRLLDKKVLAWYASNAEARPQKKLFPIPIGFANTRWEPGNITELMYGFDHYRKPWAKRTTLLYVNFSTHTNRIERFNAILRAREFKNVQFVVDRISFRSYLEQLGNAKFVLSPPGNGPDCHRTWEAMLMGAAPVVIRSGLDSLFQQVPAVVLPDWSNLTEGYLLSLSFSSYDNLVPSVLYARYWREKLRKHRRG